MCDGRVPLQTKAATVTAFAVTPAHAGGEENQSGRHEPDDDKDSCYGTMVVEESIEG